MDMPGKLVVRTYAPARRWTMFASALLLGTVALYLAFEFGRQKAGFDGIQAAEQRGTLENQIVTLQASTHDLQVQLAAADESRIAQVRERSEVAKTIGELQAALGRAQQDLDFYRGIANPLAAAKTPNLRVQQFQVLTNDAAAHRYTFRFALSRTSRVDETSAGTLAMTVDGERAGVAASVDLAALTASKQKEVPYSFRYYSNIEQPVTLPADFRAERVTIEIRPARKSGPPYRQIFVWNPDAS